MIRYAVRWQLPQTLSAPIGTIADKARMARLVLDVRTHSVQEILRRPDGTTAERLARAGFSERFVESFCRPLFAGIQLDPELEVSSRRFETILRMLATGATALPRRGIGAIPTQLAASLPTQAIRLHAPVARIDGSSVFLEDGERIEARAVVLATDGPEAHRLLPAHVPDPGSRAAGCCWFATRGAPRQGATLMLDGDRSGPAMNVVVISEVASSYAPPGSSLVAAAVPGAAALDGMVTDRVREQLARWFGSYTADWEHLRTDVIPHGQPAQAPPLHPRRRVKLDSHLYVCGDHRDTASVQGAMFSGERTARSVLRELHSRSG